MQLSDKKRQKLELQGHVAFLTGYRKNPYDRRTHPQFYETWQYGWEAASLDAKHTAGPHPSKLRMLWGWMRGR